MAIIIFNLKSDGEVLRNRIELRDESQQIAARDGDSLAFSDTKR